MFKSGCCLYSGVYGIPFENSDGKNVHNEKGIDADIILLIMLIYLFSLIFGLVIQVENRCLLV